MYELYDPMTVMFFYRNKHIMIGMAVVILCRASSGARPACQWLRRARARPAPSAADMGTGNNNKITWAFNEKQDMIDMIETVYRGAKKGRGLVSGTGGATSPPPEGKPFFSQVVSPKDFSTKYKY